MVIVEPQVESLEEAAVHIASLTQRIKTLEKEVRQQAQMIDTLWTPTWKKLWFWIDGWPLYRLADKRKPRPWHGN